MDVFSSSVRGAQRICAPRILSPDETKLVRAAQRGDVRAFNQLLARHQERAYRVAFHLLHGTRTATNNLQNVVVQAFSSIRELRDEAFEIWFLRLVVRHCATYLKLYPASVTPRTAIQHSLETLPLVERITLILADMENLAPQDIAQITRAEIATVRERTHHARCVVRDALQSARPQTG